MSPLIKREIEKPVIKQLTLYRKSEIATTRCISRNGLVEFDPSIHSEPFSISRRWSQGPSHILLGPTGSNKLVDFWWIIRIGCILYFNETIFHESSCRGLLEFIDRLSCWHLSIYESPGLTVKKAIVWSSALPAQRATQQFFFGSLVDAALLMANDWHTSQLAEGGNRYSKIDYSGWNVVELSGLSLQW